MVSAMDRLCTLTREQCLLRLRKGGVGRVAVTLGALPAVFPVSYAMLDEDVVFRTGAGTKLTAAVRRAVLAFEIDGANSLAHAGWSVLVVGPSHQITDGDELDHA